MIGTRGRLSFLVVLMVFDGRSIRQQFLRRQDYRLFHLLIHTRIVITNITVVWQ